MKVGDERLLQGVSSGSRAATIRTGEMCGAGDGACLASRIALGAALAALIVAIAIQDLALEAGWSACSGRGQTRAAEQAERARSPDRGLFALPPAEAHLGNLGAPLERCLDSVPTIKEIANSRRTFLLAVDLSQPGHLSAPGPVRGFRDPNFGFSKIGMIGCNVGSSSTSLVPTAKRPITADTRRNQLQPQAW